LIEFYTLNFIFFWYSNIYTEFKVLYSYCIYLKQYMRYNYYKYNYE